MAKQSWAQRARVPSRRRPDTRVEMGSESFFREGVSKVFDDKTSVCEKGLRLVIEETRKTLKITRDVPVSEVADLSILREAQRELGIKAR